MDGSAGWAASAVGLGFAYAALPGAVNAEALRRGVAGGFPRAFLVHAGGTIGAGMWAVVALSGTSLVARYDAVTAALGLIGAVFLLRLTFIALRGARSAGMPSASASRRGADLSAGLVVGIANPAGLPFWTGLASDVVLRSEENALDLGRAALFVGGVLLGSLLWAGTLSTLIAWGRGFLKPGFFRTVNALCALAFGYFAVRMLWSVVGEMAG